MKRLTPEWILVSLFLVWAGCECLKKALEPAPAAAPKRLPTWKVDLNSASAEEIALLPGLGPSKARAIVRRRKLHGSFQDWNDLLEVPGIGPWTLEEIRKKAEYNAPNGCDEEKRETPTSAGSGGRGDRPKSPPGGFRPGERPHDSRRD